MAKCAYCNSTIIFGGVRDGDNRYCNQRCFQSGALIRVAEAIPEDEVRQRIDGVHQGACPKCHGAGPVDVYTAHSVWSALVITTYKSAPRVSCVRCGKKSQLIATVSSLFLGWWGFPWGLIMTPVQITRNVVGLARSKPSMRPSPQLGRIVRLQMAAELRADARRPLA